MFFNLTGNCRLNRRLFFAVGAVHLLSSIAIPVHHRRLSYTSPLPFWPLHRCIMVTAMLWTTSTCTAAPLPPFTSWPAASPARPRARHRTPRWPESVRVHERSTALIATSRHDVGDSPLPCDAGPTRVPCRSDVGACACSETDAVEGRVQCTPFCSARTALWRTILPSWRRGAAVNTQRQRRR